MHTLTLPISFGALNVSSRCWVFQHLLPPPLCWATHPVLTPTLLVTPFLQQPRQREGSYEQMKTARYRALSIMPATLPGFIFLHCHWSSLTLILRGTNRLDGIAPGCLIPEPISPSPSPFPWTSTVPALGSPSLPGHFKDYNGLKIGGLQVMGPPDTSK